MKPQETTGKDLKARLLAELKKDPKRAAILGVLTLVLVIVGGRMLLNAAPSPAKASASPAKPAAAKKPERAAKGADEIAARRGSLTPEKVLLDRDLFAPNPAFFPPAKPTAAAERTKVKEEEDPSVRQAAARKKVLAEAHALGLQSTMVGSSPTAIVNGQILRVGDVVHGFKVLGISSRSCTIEKQDVQVTLEMMN